ncbi:unnamed protein product [Adineta steineri]|uniref:DNA-directed RNA polymerases I, II, and III subunit RPABC3 n=1 Tax=Adineta steineri TaxID=433720 RepID=A0A818ZA58_9BILA|nr:unnamed protein product [Adineta steineri]
MENNCILLEDIFQVKDLNIDTPEKETQRQRKKKYFQHVSRLFCESELFKMALILDVNTQVYPLSIGDKFRFLLCTTLYEDGTSDTGEYDPNIEAKRSRADQFDYVMYGQVYRIEDDRRTTVVSHSTHVEANNTGPILDDDHDDATTNSTTLCVYVSFGGLLMRLQANADHLQHFQMGSNIYLMMKKVAF